MLKFTYPATLTPDEGGGYVVTFRDLPEIITQGDTTEEALEEAGDALEEAIAARIRLKEDIPVPSKPLKGEMLVELPVETASKAALYYVIRESGLSKVQLAARLGCDEKEVRRLLDPHHPSKLPRIEAALNALGKKLVIGLDDAAWEHRDRNAGKANFDRILIAQAVAEGWPLITGDRQIGAYPVRVVW